MTALVIAAGAFEPFYLRIFTMDRAQFRASMTELPYRKLPGLRTLLVETRARTNDGDTIAIFTPFSWEQGYEYAYARSLYTLAGRNVVLAKDVAKAQWICAYGGAPQVPGFTVVWRSPNASILARSPWSAAASAAPFAGGGAGAPLILVLIAFIAGFPLALVVDRSAVGARLAGESLLLGIALCAAMLMFVPWTRAAFLATVIIIAALLFAIALRAKRNPEELRTQDSGLRTVFNVATIVLLIGYALFATAGPIWEFDFLSDWGLKAREFFNAGQIDWGFLETAWYRSTHPDYPPLLPLAFDAVAIVRGFWSDEALGLFNVAFAAGLLLAVYRFAIEDLRASLPASFVTLAMVPLAATPWIGLAEAPFVAYATAGLLLMRKNVTAGAVMLGCAALTKNEGVSLIVAAALALILTRRVRDVWRLWPAVAIPLPWWILRSLHHLQTDITSGNVLTRVMQHATDPAVLRALMGYSLGKPLFWIGLAVGIALTFRKLDRFVLIAVVLQLLFYVGAYLATPHDVAWHVQWSWERLIAHLTPAVTFLVLTQLLGLDKPEPLY